MLYLEEQRKLIKSDGAKQGVECQKCMLDLDEVVYMLNYDIKKKLPLHYILPGGNMCAMKVVSSGTPQSSMCVSLMCDIER
jgi:hypothetical protein